MSQSENAHSAASGEPPDGGSPVPTDPDLGARSPSTKPGSASTSRAPSLDAGLSREHLANERTFLAWTRTGIAMMGLGVLIARLRFEVQTQPLSSRLIHAADLGLLFAGSGVVVVLLSIWRYATVRRMLREGRFESSLYGPLLFGAAIALIGVVILFYLLERLPFGLP